jgi:hypothetical protein
VNRTIAFRRAIHSSTPEITPPERF